MQTRIAVSSDLDRLVPMRHALWPEASLVEHRDDLRDLLNGSPRSTLPLVVIVTEEDSTLIGFVEVGLRSHADGCDPRRPVGFIEGWYVSAEARGSGVGRLLIDAAEQWAAAQGCNELASDTWADNTAARAAHEALGFEVVDVCVNYRRSIKS